MLPSASTFVGVDGPRRRRAAAVAGELKMKQLMTGKDFDLGVLDDDDVDYIGTRINGGGDTDNATAARQRLSAGQSIVQHNAVNKIQKTPTVNSQVTADLTSQRKRKWNRSYDEDTNYEPNSVNQRFEPAKSITLARKYGEAALRKVRDVDDPEETHVFVVGRKLPITYGIKSPPAFKKDLVPNEPLCLPKVAEAEEESIVDFNVSEDVKMDVSEEETGSLWLDVLGREDQDKVNEKEKEKEDDCVVIEESPHRSSSTKSLLAPSAKFAHIKVLEKPNRLRYNTQYAKLTKIPTGSLEMECETAEDDFSDAMNVCCEDDLLSENQWNQTMEAKKNYANYAKVLTEAKRNKNVIKFLDEKSVEHPIGTEIVSTKENIIRLTQQPKPKTTPIRVKITNPGAFQLRGQTPVLTTTLLSNNAIPTQAPLRAFTMGNRPIILVPSIPNSQGFGRGIILQPRTGAVTTQPLRLIRTPNVATPSAFSVGGLPVTTAYVFDKRPNILRPQVTPLRFNTPIRPNIATTAPMTLATLNNLPLTTSVQSSVNDKSNTTTSSTNSITDQNTSLLTTLLANSAQNCVPKSMELFNHTKTANCLAVIKGTGQKMLNVRTLLTIKPLPISWPSKVETLIQTLIQLDNTLMREKFKESPIQWMIKSQLLKYPLCTKCSGGQVCSVLPKTNEAAHDFWKCDNCSNTFRVEHPLIFDESFKTIPVSKLLFVIYYWSIQVDVEDLVKTGQIDMRIEAIYSIWRKLQLICFQMLSSASLPLGANKGPYKTVELATVQVSKFFVIGAMEVHSQHIKLQVISCAAKNLMENFVIFVKRYIHQGNCIKTCESKFKILENYGYQVKLVDKLTFLDVKQEINEPELKFTNLGGYMIQHLERLFKEIDMSTLTHETLRLVLEELQWRERFGRNPFEAFSNIIKHIAKLCQEKEDKLKRDDIFKMSVTSNIINYSRASREIFTNAQLPEHATTSPTIISPFGSNYLTNHLQTFQKKKEMYQGPSVVVDEYYYASLNRKKESSLKETQEEGETSQPNNSIQCHLCQMFFDNVLIVKHIMEHLEKERRGRVRRGDNNEVECRHCFRFFDQRILSQHEDAANMKRVQFSCRICQLPFTNRENLITHMKQNHFAGEMPYYCGVCSYRSSFQKNLHEHFEKNHQNTVICTFCLKILKKKNKNISEHIYDHISTHYAIASVYECEKCISIFTSEKDLGSHYYKGHNAMMNFTNDEEFEVVTYVVPADERPTAVRAYESELFVPNLPNQDISSSPTPSNYISMQPNATSTSNPEPNADLEQPKEDEENEEEFFIEPEIQINEDAQESFENLIFPLDTDLSDEYLVKMLSRFDLSDKIVPDKENIITIKESGVKCKECNNYIATDHFSKKLSCNFCKYITHCKQAFVDHEHRMHPKEGLVGPASVLGTNPALQNQFAECTECSFKSNYGNIMSYHLATSNHPFFKIKNE